MARAPPAVRTTSVRVSVSPALIGTHCPARWASTLPVDEVTWNVASSRAGPGEGDGATAALGASARARAAASSDSGET